MDLYFRETDCKIKVMTEESTSSVILAHKAYASLGDLLIKYTEIDFNGLIDWLSTELNEIKNKEYTSKKQISKALMPSLDKIKSAHPYLEHELLYRSNIFNFVFELVQDKVKCRLSEVEYKKLFDLNIYEIKSSLEKLRQIAEIYIQVLNFLSDINKDSTTRRLTPAQKFFSIQNRWWQDGASIDSPLTISYIVEGGDYAVGYPEFDFDFDSQIESSREIVDPSSAIVELYHVDIKTALYIEVIKILEKNVVIKKCENCNKYFVPTSRTDEKYCGRIQSNNKSCKQSDGYLKNDLGIKMYRNKYQAFNQLRLRSKNLDWVNEAFLNWTIEADKKKRDYKAQNISLEEFQGWLDESYRKIKLRQQIEAYPDRCSIQEYMEYEKIYGEGGEK